jgi:uncharacterized protein (TIGR02466 family)
MKMVTPHGFLLHLQMNCALNNNYKQEAMENVAQQDSLNISYLFAAPVYAIEKPEFLDVARKISNKYIEKRKQKEELNPMYPVHMTENINYDEEMLPFANYVAQTAWNILSEQGYAMSNYSTYFTEMWCQEHHKTSMMEKHIHANNVRLTGFYFLDCPKGCSRVVFHDPRDSKVITNLPEKDYASVTHASNMVNFDPKEGTLIFANPWLPHSFTKNESKKPMRFIHFNVTVAPIMQQNMTCAPAEVI